MATMKNLIELLDKEEAWPARFRWNFLDPDRCAMGLAREVYGEAVWDRIAIEVERKAWACGVDFLCYWPFSPSHYSASISFSIQPQDVANALRKIEEAYQSRTPSMIKAYHGD